MVDPVEELLQVKIHHPDLPARDVRPPRLQRLMGALAGPEPVARSRERRVVHRGQHLQDRLLDESIHHRRDAQRPHPAARLRDLCPLHRLWPIRPVQQFLLQARPCLLEVRRQLLRGHPIHTGAAFVRPHPLECPPQVRGVDHLLHEGLRQGSRSVRRRSGWRPFAGLRPGFTRLLPVKGQLPGLLPHSRSSLTVVPCAWMFGPSPSLPGYYGLG